tara:strand:- start:899 stop:1180 length:282 start_codon:yes stop_codon:yes gene_type:complete
MEHSKYYWEKDRNISTTIPEDNRVPHYYIGDTERQGKYQARYVVDDFHCTYHVGNAVTYCLRAKYKHDSEIECLQKAIAHLTFEIERLQKKLK